MSLVQHVSAVEGVDREPLDDAATDIASLSSFPLSRVSTRQRRTSISYDPVPLKLPGEDEGIKREEHVGAYEISERKRLAQVVVGVISCVVGSGIVFGFAALKSVLVDEDVYRELCTQDELREDVPVCYMQDLKLNFTFNIASVTTNVSALVVGALLDRYGPRLCGIVSSVMLFFGALCMAFEHDLPFDAIIAGHFLLALGGTFIFVPSFHLSNAFPRYQGLILALVTGAFDSSAAIFLFFRVLYEKTQHQFGLKHFFLLYLAVPLFVFFTQVFLMPSKSYETRAELQEDQEKAEDPALDLHESDDELDDSEMWKVRTLRAEDRKRIRSEIRTLLGSTAEQVAYDQDQVDKRIASQGWGALHGLSAFAQMRTPWFILITIFTILQMARMNFFIATIWSQYLYMLHSVDLADRINNIFDVVLPLAGVAAVPFIGTLLDNLPIAGVLGIVVTVSGIIGILGVIPTFWAGYLNVVFFCLLRPLYYSAMSDFAVKVFGLATFGTIYGTIICVSGLLTFAQSALQSITHDVFLDNPSPVNLILLAFTLVSGVALVSYVTIAGKKVQQEVLDEEETRSMLPTPRATPRLGPIQGLGSPHLGPTYGTMGAGMGSLRGRDSRPSFSRPSLANLRQLSMVNEEEGSAA